MKVKRNDEILLFNIKYLGTTNIRNKPEKHDKRIHILLYQMLAIKTKWQLTIVQIACHWPDKQLKNNQRKTNNNKTSMVMKKKTHYVIAISMSAFQLWPCRLELDFEKGALAITPLKMPLSRFKPL